MSESDFYTVNDRYKAQGAAAEWPAWELQGYGSAAPAPEPPAPEEPAHGPGADAPRADPLGPWFSARLNFSDGARIDVLVAVRDDRLTVEDMRADPPLSLDGLATLARWIEGPLDDACRRAAGHPRKPGPAPEAGPTPKDPEDPADPADPAPHVPTGEGADGAADEAAGGDEAESGADGGSEGRADAPGPAACAEPDAEPDAEPAPEPAPEPALVRSVSPAAATPPSSASASSPALLAGTRVSERRRFAAQVYREAQRAGQDPVLAVMNATGRNRRRSLRLIAGARDEGFLTPRHNKR